ncbi:hypothetical protein CASFOL_041374 [Castilleja foliolosa]|uniref:SKP1 component POZ domain-containing protein n=1 Tax=Castilleja foliolosa TaxID=1961234 RepID=A0ABD3BE80_9LAMI
MATADQSGSEKKIVLRIRRSEEEEEGEEFLISESGAALSGTLKKMLEDGADGVITLTNVRKYTIQMIIDYLETHATATATERGCRDFDREFASGKDHYLLKGLMIDADTLKIRDLTDLLARKIADYVRNKSIKYRFIVLRGREPTTEEKEQWRNLPRVVDWDEQRRLEELDELDEQLAQANIRNLLEI